MAENIHEGHRKRLKNRFISEDIDNFEHHNILELLLFYAIPRMDTNAIAHSLIKHFGGISEVFDAPHSELVKIKGVSENAATLIKLIPSMSRVYMKNKSGTTLTLNSSQLIGEYFVNQFIGKNQELVYIMTLDSSCSVINCDVLAQGTVTQANISIRAITEKVVKHNACSVVLAHNHPRGLAVASNEDIITTVSIKKALKQLDIVFLDHIIVAQNQYASLAELGYI